MEASEEGDHGLEEVVEVVEVVTGPWITGTWVVTQEDFSLEVI